MITRIFSYFFSAVALAAVLCLFTVLLWQSWPAWRAEGLSLVTGTRWFFRQEQFGAAPMILGSILTSFTALLLAAPVGLGAAVFTVEFLPPRFRLAVKMIIELLAGVPSVIYGLLGILFLRGWIQKLLAPFDPLSGDTLLTGAVLLAVMILPTVMTLADDALRGVSSAQRQAARGLGLTGTEMVLAVALPQCAPGLLAALLLGLGRALGEAVAVFLVVGRQDNQWPERLLSLRPLIEPGQTLTTKLASSETSIAFGDPLHWGALCALALMLAGLAVGIIWAGLFFYSVFPVIMRRRIIHEAFRVLTGLCAALACGILAWLVVAIASRGLPALSWEFLTGPMRSAGAEGGIVHHLAGTGILLLTALAVSAPMATALALVHGVYLRNPVAKRGLEMLLQVANGLPSIIVGIVGFIVFVSFLGWGKSWLSGGLLLGFLMLPMVTVALMERIASLPARYVEAATGLGLRRSTIIWSVILPQSMTGLVTGTLLGLARVAGEIAPIMFTATIFSGATIPQGVKDSPVLSLPYHIFVLAQDSFDPRMGGKVWGTALVMLSVVFVLSLIALPARLRISDEARHG